MSSDSKTHVPLVILGAGVIGLTIAYIAACDSDVAFDITIVARDMPGDWHSQAWASPFAVRIFRAFFRHFHFLTPILLRAQVGLRIR
jgi:glycine/D-amino acid oxidase-like deaminating enzyme